MNFDLLRERLARHPAREFGIGASDHEIEAAERQLGVRLQGSYKSFLRFFGWGGVEDLELFGIGSDVPPHLNLVTVTISERKDVEPSMPTHLVPVMNDGAGNLYCLDAGEGYAEEYPVVLWDHEAGTDQEPEWVADSFGEWLEQRIERYN